MSRSTRLTNFPANLLPNENTAEILAFLQLFRNSVLAMCRYFVRGADIPASSAAP
jgi:hypothetical protein